MGKKTRILILGGCGFIGRNIVQHLLSIGDCDITVADIKHDSLFDKIEQENYKNVNLEIIIEDFSNFESFKKLKKSYDEVYMLAAVVGVNKTIQNPHEVIRINTLLTINTLKYVSENNVKKILFASSSENYSGTSDLYDIEIPTKEDVPLCISDMKHPRWTYAITKIHGESAFLHSSKALGFECTIVRYQNIIGPKMGFGHAIPHIVERFVRLKEEPFKIYGHSDTRAFCYVSDAAIGTVQAMKSGNANGNIYHIGFPEEINMEQLTKFIGKVLNYKGQYINAETYPGSVSRRCPDISSAEKDFEYRPNFSWKDSVKYTVEWYKDFFESGQKPKEGGFIPPDEVLKES